MKRAKRISLEICFLVLTFANYVGSELPTIRPLPCSNRMTGELGVCTFYWSCINVAHGVHIGSCVDRFFIGACCKIPQGTEGQGPGKSDSYPNSNTHNGTSYDGDGEGTRKVGEMPPYSQLHYAMAPKAQKEKLNGTKTINLIDIDHFNVSLNPANYYDYQHNETSFPQHEHSLELNKTTVSEQNPSVDHRNIASSPSQKLNSTASFFYTLLFSNHSNSKSSEESLNKTAESVITSLGNNGLPIHSRNYSNHDLSLEKTTSSNSNPASPVLGQSSIVWRKPVSVHHSHDERKPLKPHDQHNLRKPVGYNQSPDFRRPVTHYIAHDERKPLKPHDQHDLRKPVSLDKSHVQRWPDEDHDGRWPVLDEEDHDGRMPVLDEEQDQGFLVTKEDHNQESTNLSDDNRLSIEHLFKFIGNHTTYSNHSPSNSDHSKVIPTSELKTTPVPTEPTHFPYSATSYFSDKSSVPNLEKDVASTKVTSPTYSSEGSTKYYSSPNITLFIRPTSSRPSYKPFWQPQESKPTGAKFILKDLSKICGRSRSGATARIVGGMKSRGLRWPWMISLRRLDEKYYYHKCGAVLLNQYWVATAAHCIDGKNPTDIILRLGEYNFGRADDMFPHVERSVYVVVIHPKFDRITYEYDLALLRFEYPVELKANIVPVCLPHNLDDITGRIAVVVGWGRLESRGVLPSSLHEVHLPILSNEECEQMYYEAGFLENIRDVFVCAGVSSGGLDACEGDSGGPMVIRGDQGEWVLVGLISWGMGCAAPKQPGVYTRVSLFTDWIEDIISY